MLELEEFLEVNLTHFTDEETKVQRALQFVQSLTENIFPNA